MAITITITTIAIITEIILVTTIRTIRGDVKKSVVLGGAHYKLDGRASRAGPHFWVKKYQTFFFASIRPRSLKNV